MRKLRARLNITLLAISAIFMTAFVIHCHGIRHHGMTVYNQQTSIESPTYVTFTDKQWWALYGYTYTSNRYHELLLNFNVEWGAGWSLIEVTLDLDVKSFNITSVPPFWNEGTNTLSGNMQGIDSNGTFELTFYPNEFRVWTISVSDIVLKVETWRIGEPIWAGKTESDMSLVTVDPNGTPIYAGGFTEGITINATLTQPTQTMTFQGFGLYTRGWMKPHIKAQGYWTLLFLNSQPGFTLIVFDSRNPDTNEIFTHMGMISFILENASYELDTFTIRDSGGGRPLRYNIEGTFEGGSFNLTGERIGWLQYGQVHPYIRWTGTITKGGRVINVDSLGSGEIFRGWRGIKSPASRRLLPIALVGGAVGIAVIAIAIALARRRRPRNF